MPTETDRPAVNYMQLVSNWHAAVNNHAIWRSPAVEWSTFLLVSLSLLPSAERSSDSCFGSQKWRAEVGRARTVELLVHVRFYGSQPREEQVVRVVVRHADC